MVFKKVNILGVPFIHASMEQFINQLHLHIINNEKVTVVTANPEIVMKAKEDSYYMTLLRNANYVTPDGIGIVKAAQLLGSPLPERVAGFDTMIELLKLGNIHNYNIYLLGAKEEVLEGAKQKIKKDYPNVNVVGSHNGFFDWTNEEIPNQIKSLEPDLVFVALGMPRQEEWIFSQIEKFEKGIFMGVGGSFDVLSGTVNRAPEIWQKLNIEWLYRLVKQPSRAVRMMALPRFALEIFKKKVLPK
ncbi:WecB/TagA/CpsF family glycosyltransferase [Bacillus pinisoli]|uniref:WecB/TagA/CpsF family glycosyltransferase n=1 Tax=Bacillus pinisoli TaxID=2901866 RepID=UPI001FF167DD|nr:WecB/TagA/CpsF family glycosyltransferase [Bacillus pinisoli]